MIASRAGLAEGDPLQQVPFSQLRSRSQVQNILVIQIQRARFNLLLSRRIPFNVNISFKLPIPFSSNSPLSQLSPFVNFQSIQSALPAKRSAKPCLLIQKVDRYSVQAKHSLKWQYSLVSPFPSFSSAREAKHRTLSQLRPRSKTQNPLGIKVKRADGPLQYSP